MSFNRRQARKPKLLVVDDDDAFREAMELEFTDRGFHVLYAADHRNALGLAAMHHPQFAVIDLRLNGERGLEVLKDLKERLPHMRAVVLTGYGSIATSVEAIKLGANHYLTKPCDPDEIEAGFNREEGDPSVDLPDQIPHLHDMSVNTSNTFCCDRRKYF